MSEKMLIKKLAKVMQQVKYIEKKGFNKFHQYKYATESDVAEKVREVLADQNVMMIPNMKEHSVRTHITAKEKTEYIATVLIEFTFMDGDTGETFSFCMAGEGQDAGDKAYYKAITGAQKYALMKAFMIPTGDDPEGDAGVDERNETTKPNQQQPNKKAAETTNESKVATLKAKWHSLSGSLDGFDDFYEKQLKAGYNENQIDVFLTKKLKMQESKGT